MTLNLQNIDLQRVIEHLRLNDTCSNAKICVYNQSAMVSIITKLWAERSHTEDARAAATLVTEVAAIIGPLGFVMIQPEPWDRTLLEKMW